MKLSRILAATAIAGVIAAPAYAGSPTLKSVPHTGSKGKLKITMGGQINALFAVVNDGESTEVFFGSNDASSNRLFLKAKGSFGEGFEFGAKVEYEFEPNSSDKFEAQDKIAVGNSSGDFFNLRYFDGYFEYNDTFRISLGQGDTATNKTLESDLSGTKNVSYANVDAFLEDYDVLFDGGGASGLDVEEFLFAHDGQSRQWRARADLFFGESGFNLAASVGQTGSRDDRDAPLFFDIAAHYKAKIGDTKVQASAGHVFNYENDDDGNGDGDFDDLSVTSLSASVLFPFGVSLTGAFERMGSNDFHDSKLYYVKLGYQTDEICDWGTTAFAIDWTHGKDFDPDETYNDATGDRMSFAVAQDIDAIGSEIYFGVSHYWFDADGVDFESITAGMTGFKTSF